MTTNANWISLCSKADLIADSGVCALVEGRQVALFYLPADEQVYAIDNHDPFGQANVLSRGILGSIGDVPVVASPLYKQRFSLVDGQCFDDETVKLTTWQVALENDVLLINPTPL